MIKKNQNYFYIFIVLFTPYLNGMDVSIGSVADLRKLDRAAFRDSDLTLYNAVAAKDLSMLQDLIARGADVNVSERSNQSLILYAMRQHFFDGVHVLLQNGAKGTYHCYEDLLRKTISNGYCMMPWDVKNFEILLANRVKPPCDIEISLLRDGISQIFQREQERLALMALIENGRKNTLLAATVNNFLDDSNYTLDAAQFLRELEFGNKKRTCNLQ